jgi:hypothetical protein
VLAGHRDDRQVDAGRKVTRAGERLRAVQVDTRGVDGVRLALETRGQQRFEHAAAKVRRAFGDAQHRDSGRPQNSFERCDGRLTLAFVGRGCAGRRRLQRQPHFHAASLGGRVLLESGIAEDVEHFEVFGQHAGGEGFEILHASGAHELLEQRRRNASAV